MAEPYTDDLDGGYLRRVIAEFQQTQEGVDVWRRYPDVTTEEDDWTDTHACDTFARAFTTHCDRAGIYVHTVYADGPDGYHYWTRAHGINVDWTARQYHNLQCPPDPAHLDIPCPLVWVGDTHPIVGFDTIEELQ